MAAAHSKQAVGEESVGCADSESRYSHFPATSSMEAHPPEHMDIPMKAPWSLLGGLRCPFSNTNLAWNIKCSLSYESSGFLDEK